MSDDNNFIKTLAGGDQRKAFPTLKQTIELKSYHSNKVIDRVFAKTGVALFNVNVVLRALAKREQADEVHKSIQSGFDVVFNDLVEAQSQAKKLLDDNGITELPEYENASVYEITITSPSMATLLKLLKQMDQLMVMFDALWFYGVFSDRQKSDGCYEWQRRLIKTCNRVIGIEKRARAAAYKIRQSGADSDGINAHEDMAQQLLQADGDHEADELHDDDDSIEPSPKRKTSKVLSEEPA